MSSNGFLLLTGVLMGVIRARLSGQEVTALEVDAHLTLAADRHPFERLLERISMKEIG